jgi:tryptophan-rich sensory protein
MRGFLRNDDLRLGIVLGFLAPFIGLLIYYFVQFRVFTLAEFFYLLVKQRSLLTAVISISLVANAVIFTAYINTHRDRTARGIFIATCMYAIVALVYKIIG